MNPNFGHNKNQINDYNGYIPHGEDPSDYAESDPSEEITIDDLNPSYYGGLTEQSPNLDTYSNSNDESAPGAHIEEIAGGLAQKRTMQEQTAVPAKSHDTAAIDVTKLTPDELARSIGNSREIAYNNSKEELEALQKETELLLEDLKGTETELRMAMEKAAEYLKRIEWLKSYSKKLSTEQDELSPTFRLERPGTTTSVTETLEKNSQEGFGNLGKFYTDREGFRTNPGMEDRGRDEEGGLPEEYSSFRGSEGESNNTSPEDSSENIA